MFWNLRELNSCIRGVVREIIEFDAKCECKRSSDATCIPLSLMMLWDGYERFSSGVLGDFVGEIIQFHRKCEYTSFFLFIYLFIWSVNEIYINKRQKGHTKVHEYTRASYAMCISLSPEVLQGGYYRFSSNWFCWELYISIHFYSWFS